MFKNLEFIIKLIFDHTFTMFVLKTVSLKRTLDFHTFMLKRILKILKIHRCSSMASSVQLLYFIFITFPCLALEHHGHIMNFSRLKDVRLNILANIKRRGNIFRFNEPVAYTLK